MSIVPPGLCTLTPFAEEFNAYTPNANIANPSVGVLDESQEDEAREALMFCFYNASPVKSCFVIDLVYFISLCLRVAVSLNATRRDSNFSTVRLVSLMKMVETKERSSLSPRT